MTTIVVIYVDKSDFKMYNCNHKEGGEKMLALEEILKINNMKISDLSKKLGIARGNIYNWINGKRPIPKDKLEELEEMFGIPKELFLKDNLSRLERLEVENAMAGRLIKENSFEYEDEEEDENGGYEKVTKTYIDNNLLGFKEALSSEIEKEKAIEKVVAKIRTTLYSTDDFERRLGTVSRTIDILVSSKVSPSILNLILKAVAVAYEIEQNDDNITFVNSIVDIIHDKETEIKDAKKQIEESFMGLGINIEDLFK